MVIYDWCDACVNKSIVDQDEKSEEWQKICYRCEDGDDENLIAPSLFQPKKLVNTNGDKIRQFSDIQLSKFLPNKQMWNCPPDIKKHGGCLGACEPCWLRYLQRPVEVTSNE